MIKTILAAAAIAITAASANAQGWTMSTKHNGATYTLMDFPCPDGSGRWIASSITDLNESVLPRACYAIDADARVVRFFWYRKGNRSNLPDQLPASAFYRRSTDR